MGLASYFTEKIEAIRRGSPQTCAPHAPTHCHLTLTLGLAGCTWRWTAHAPSKASLSTCVFCIPPLLLKAVATAPLLSSNYHCRGPISMASNSLQSRSQSLIVAPLPHMIPVPIGSLTSSLMSLPSLTPLQTSCPPYWFSNHCVFLFHSLSGRLSLTLVWLILYLTSQWDLPSLEPQNPSPQPQHSAPPSCSALCLFLLILYLITKFVYCIYC